MPATLLDLIKSYRDSTRQWPTTDDIWEDCRDSKGNPSWALPHDGVELGLQLRALVLAGAIEEQEKRWAIVEKAVKVERSLF